MYESMTYESILDQLLGRVPDDVDTREGSIIYDALAPCAAELAQMYIELDTILNETFADTATGEYLELRARERGLTRQSATYAIVQGVFTPKFLDLKGQRFTCGEYTYVVTNATDVSGTYNLTCETAGSAPNSVIGNLIPVDYIEALGTACISSILVPGEDEESDDNLRTRYFNSFESNAFGGNVSDYKEKVNSISGVGGVKVTPVWNGGGTVLLTIQASDYSAPSSTLINTVQNEIDPTQDGTGIGIAPIGHVVTVVGVINTTINVSTTLTYQSGYDWATVKEEVESAIDEYFNELSKTWQDKDSIIIRVSQIETRILSCTGILDIDNTTINEGTANIQLESNCIPVRGDVTDGS